MAAKVVRIFAANLLVCLILLPWLASSSSSSLDPRPEFLEHDSRNTDVTIHGDNNNNNNNNNVVVANANDFAIPSSDDETRKERSLKEEKSKKKKNEKGNKFPEREPFDPLKSAREGIHKIFSIFPRVNVPKTAEQHVEPETNGGLQEGNDQEGHVQPEVNGGVQEGNDQEQQHVQPEVNGGVQEGNDQEQQHVEPEVNGGVQEGNDQEQQQVEPETAGGLREGFYQQTCPQAEKIIRDGLIRASQNDSTIHAAFPRLFLHDCFVNGCDGSIFLDATPSGAKIEKLAPTNGVTVRGFELVDEIKAELEENCPGIVSCSDILAYLSRDALVESGLPHYEVPGGRRDGTESLEANVGGNHPLPDDSVDKMINIFKKKGLNVEDLVVLIGAHSIGVAHCFNFLYRLDTPEKAEMVDPRLSNVMRTSCASDMTTLAFDTTTQYKLDSTFYKQLLTKRGLLESDQVLAQDIRTRGLVQRFSNDETGWFDKFGKAMNKLGAIEVLTGNQGQIRKQCRAVNL